MVEEDKNRQTIELAAHFVESGLHMLAEVEFVNGVFSTVSFQGSKGWSRSDVALVYNAIHSVGLHLWRSAKTAQDDQVEDDQVMMPFLTPWG